MLNQFFTLKVNDQLCSAMISGALILACLLFSKISLAEPVSFKGQVLPVLMDRCSVCHMREDSHGYLVIDEEYAYIALVNVPSFTLPKMKRVEPGDPQLSYFWLKITGEHLDAGGQGWAMPYMTKLNKKEKKLIYDWIAQGAKDN